MTATGNGKPSVVAVQALLGHDRDEFKRLLRESPQEVVEAELTELLIPMSVQDEPICGML
ncbi:MAG: hypothetical protein MUD07_00170 [Burkholderiaceae bacterium]|jgi:hypothetical protein|nr:hypothetical protein [Burkholderiaceae bacterium]